MNYRDLGGTGFKVSEISFGAWAIGNDWGNVSDSESLAALHRAVDLGVNFFDTADVYGDGRSEKLLAQLKKDRPEEIIMATKAGRRLAQIAENFTIENLAPTNCSRMRSQSAARFSIVEGSAAKRATRQRWPPVYGSRASTTQAIVSRLASMCASSVDLTSMRLRPGASADLCRARNCINPMG